MAIRPIDEKIVAMKMDNSDFIKKAADTTSIFGKLQSAIEKIPGVNMGKVTQSFSDIQSAAQRVDLSSISNNVEHIASQFSKLNVVAITALSNITNRAVDTGLALAKSLTIQPVTDGFREYELKMKSIGTMLANTEWAGSTLDDVKKTLGELNDYADNTIYSFSEMTSNIGRFTAAGVTLEDSATAIKGLGNLAAISGSDVNQLNTVMYQMSQALAAGKLNLMDWNSLVNGGMAGKKTQDALVATAKAMGKNVDLTDGFRNSIEQGWLTSEVFLETLKKFGNDESMTKAATSVRTFTGFIDALKESVGSGWATTWELVFGDFDEATRRWTGVSEAVGGFFRIFDNGRNSVVKAIADAGVFKGIFDGFINTTKLVLSIFKSIGSGIKDAFSGTNLGLMKTIGSVFNDMGNAIKPNEKMLKNISVIFEALFAPVALVVKVLDILGRALLQVVLVPLKLVIWALTGLVKGVLAVTGYFSELVVSFADGVKSGKDLSESLSGLSGIFSKIGSAIGRGIQHIKGFISAVKDVGEILIKGDVSNVGPWAKDSEIADKILNIRKALMDFNNSINESWKILSTGNVSEKGPWAKDSEIVGRLLKIRQAALDFAGGIEEAWNILTTGAIKTDGAWINDSEVVKKLFRIRDACLELASGVQEAWDILTTGTMKTDGPWINDTRLVKGLFKIRETVIDITENIAKTIEDWTGGLGKSFKTLGDYAESVDYSPMALTLGLVAKSLEVLVDVMKNGLWEDGSTIDKWMSKVGKGFSVIGDGAKSVVKYVKSINISLEPVTNAFDRFFDAVGNGYRWVVDKLKDVGQAIKDALPNGNQLFAGGFVAGLIAIVGVALKMAWDFYHIFTGWAGIGEGVSDTLGAVSNALNGFASSLYANAIMTIAIALGILALALWGISKVDPDRVTTGLYGLIGVMTAMVGAMAVMNKYNITGTGMTTAMQMVALGTAVLIMAGALKTLSDIKPGDLAKSVLALGGLMLALSGAVVLMSKFGGDKVGASSLQFLAIAGAMLIMAKAIEKIAKMDVGQLAKGVTTMGIIMFQMGLFFRMAGKSSFGIGSTLGMLAIGQAILNITDAVKEIAKIPVGVLAKGLTVITLILAEIALFAALTNSMGLFSAGAGMLLIAGAITALIIPITILGNMDIKTLAIGLGAMAVALVAIGAASMLMTGMVAAGAGLILVALALQMLVIPIAALGAMSWQAVVTGIVGLAGAILLIGGAAALIGLAAAPMLAFAGAVTLMGLALLAGGAGMSLFSGALVILAGMTATAITTIVATLGTLIMGLVSLIPTAVDFVVKLISQMAQAVMEKTPILFEQFIQMMLKVLNVIGDYTDDFVDAAVKIITNFIDGIAENVPKLVESATNLMVTFVEALAASVEQNGPRFITAWMSLMAEVTLLMVQAGIAVVQALFGWIPGVTEATNKIGETAEETIREAFDAEGAGEDKGDEFATALDGKTTDAETAGTNIANAGKTGAASVSMTTTGSNFAQGFANGIGGMVESVKETAKSLAKAAKDKIEEFLDINSPSRVMTTVGEHTGQGFANGIANKKKETEKSAAEVAQAAHNGFNKSMGKLRTEFRLGEISASRYVKEIEKIKKSYSSYADLVKKANTEINKVEAGAAKYRQALREQQAGDWKEWVEERKYYNELSLTEELDMWVKITNSYKKGTDERKAADREVYRVKNEINQKLLDLNEEYVAKVEDANQRLIDGEKALNDEYEQAVSDRAKSLVGFVSIFDEVQKKSDVTGQKLMDNLMGQVTTFAEWSQNIQTLANRGIDQGLLEELREMGPSAASEIAALNTLTDAQLTQYSGLWKTKNQMARNEATKELEGLREDTNTAIEELRKETELQLETYKTEWIKKIKEIRTGTTGEFVGLNASMKEIGVDSIKGLIEGMNNMTGPLVTKAKAIASSISTTIKNALQIKSPSRVTMGLGEYVSEGLAVGMSNKSGEVSDSAKGVALTAKDSLNRFIEGFELPSGDNELHFKAIIDYDTLDPSKLGISPDTTLTSGLVTATKSTLRQNGSRTSRNTSDVQTTDGKANQPIVIQSILNGRIVAEETIEDVSQLLNSRTNLDYTMKGVYGV